MGTTTTNELVTALQEMLSKNSNRFTTEEVETLNEAITGLVTLQALQKNEGKDVSNELKRASQVELLKITGSIFRFLLHPDVMKVISDMIS